MAAAFAIFITALIAFACCWVIGSAILNRSIRVRGHVYNLKTAPIMFWALAIGAAALLIFSLVTLIPIDRAALGMVG